MVRVIDECKLNGDTVGGTMEVVALGLPYGLGSYIQWDKKLNAIIASLMLSINAFKSLTIGSVGNILGSEYHDEISCQLLLPVLSFAPLTKALVSHHQIQDSFQRLL